MNDQTMTRRRFLQKAAVATTAAATLNFPGAHAAEKSKGGNWPIGCMNRPWSKWPHNVGFEGIKAAGYKWIGLISHSKDEPLITSGASPEYLGNLKKKIAALGLTASMGALRTNPAVPLADSIKDVRNQIDHAKFLSLEFL